MSDTPNTNKIFRNSIPYVVDEDGNYAIPVTGANGETLTISLSGNLAGYLNGTEKDSILVMAGRRSDSFNNVPVELTASTSAQVILASTTGKSIYITDISVSTDTAMNVKFQDTAGTPVQIIGKKYLPANSVWSKSYKTPKKLNASVGLNIVCSASSGNVSVDLDGYII